MVECYTMAKNKVGRSIRVPTGGCSAQIKFARRSDRFAWSRLRSVLIFFLRARGITACISPFFGSCRTHTHTHTWQARKKKVLQFGILLRQRQQQRMLPLDVTTRELSRQVLQMIAQLTLLGMVLSAIVMVAVAWLIWRRLYPHAHRL